MEYKNMSGYSPVEYQGNVVAKTPQGLSLLDLVAAAQDKQENGISNIHVVELRDETYELFTKQLAAAEAR